jgi:hypothetical protein
MDVFALREKVVSDYKQHIESLVRTRDERIDGFVQEELNKGALWPYDRLVPRCLGGERF